MIHSNILIEGTYIIFAPNCRQNMMAYNKVIIANGECGCHIAGLYCCTVEVCMRGSCSSVSTVLGRGSEFWISNSLGTGFSSMVTLDYHINRVNNVHRRYSQLAIVAPYVHEEDDAMFSIEEFREVGGCTSLRRHLPDLHDPGADAYVLPALLLATIDKEHLLDAHTQVFKMTQKCTQIAMSQRRSRVGKLRLHTNGVPHAASTNRALAAWRP